MDELIANVERMGSLLQRLIVQGITIKPLAILDEIPPGGLTSNPENCLAFQTEIKKGAVFDPIYLDHTKHIICTSGRLRIFKKRFWGWSFVLLTPGKSTKIAPGVVHQAHALRDSNMIAVLTTPKIAKEGPRIARIDPEKTE